MSTGSRAVMRSYGEACAAAHALDLVGERWALLLVRELLLGPKRFTDLRAGIPNATPNVLTQRLRELEEAGVVRRRKLGPPSGARVYDLTPWGLELEPVIIGLGRWGSRSPTMPHDVETGVDSMMLALKTLFDPGLASDLSGTFELWFGENVFTLTLAAGRMMLFRGEARNADATIDTNPGTLSQLMWQALPIAEAQRAGQLKFAGDIEKLERLLAIFPLPPPAELTEVARGHV